MGECCTDPTERTGFCEPGNALSGSRKCREFLDWPRKC